MELGAYTYIIGGSLIILLSFLCSMLAKRTNIPAVLMLIALGLGLQYFLKFLGIRDVNFFPALEVLGIVGLIMIVLEAALELKLKRDKIPIILKSTAVALLGFLASVLAAAYIIKALVPGMGLTLAFLYAVPLSILSSAIIIPSVENLSKHKQEFHVYESTLSDIIGIIAFYFVLELLNSGDPTQAGHAILGEFVLGLLITIVIGIVASYALITVFQRIQSKARLFLLISILLLLYAVGKLAHLSPLIIILIFGIMVANEELFFRGKLKRLLHIEKFNIIEQGLNTITVETAFVVRTFFFVIFGASIAISTLLSWDVLLICVLLLASIYFVRGLLLRVFLGKDVDPQVWIAPRGLITILLFYAIPAEYQNEAFHSGIILFLIIATGLIMTYGMVSAGKREKKKQAEQQT